MGQSGQVGRYAGFEKVGMLDHFEVLSTQTANWKRDEAMALAEDWLTTYGDDLKAIICEALWQPARLLEELISLSAA